ncbi:MAG: Aldo-keto reductase IolS [Candidatus Celerinatantimonas neptuna]|nr:MAG: Aldo-keto reductase IolS [Candidatus Celerinatantimonas neptuna]
MNETYHPLTSLNGHLIPRIGLGCMGMSEFYGQSDRTQNLAVLNRAVELGYRHFDTADMYGMGENENLLGEFLQTQPREQLFIATKFGIKRNRSGTLKRTIDGSRDYIRRSLHDSLKRLKLDYIDLYYIHRRDSTTPIEETIDTLAKLKQDGLIRGIGLCEVSLKTYLKAHRVHPITAIQSEYSLLSREPEQGILPACQEHGTTFVAYSPMSRGLLTAKITASRLHQTGDNRTHLPRFNHENLEHNLSLVEMLNVLAKQKHCTTAQVALAWVLHQSSHIHIIPGTRQEKYLIDNWQSQNIHLTDEELRALQQHFTPEKVHGARYPQAAMSGINE